MSDARNILSPMHVRETKALPILQPKTPSPSTQNKTIDLTELNHRVTVHSIRPLGSDWGAYTSASLPVFLRPLCQLISFQHLS